MKYAAIYSVRAETAHGFVWTWRSNEHPRKSSMSFVVYEDCVADARKKGYTIVQTKPTLP